MKYLNIKAVIALFSLGCMVFSCKKVDTPSPIGDAGKTVLKVYNGGDNPDYGHTLLGVDFVNKPQTITAFEVYRDVNSNASLNTSLVAVVKDDTAAITAYNAANGTHMLPLPRNWYTTNVPLSAVGGTYNLAFAAGDYAKTINLTIPNSTLLDPSSSYGIAFTLVSNNGSVAMGTGKTFIFEIGAKNAYDGIYSVVSGLVTRYTGPGAPAGDALSGSVAGNPDITMSTTGANTVYMAPLYWADGNTNGPVGGVDPLYVTVDPATNLTTTISTPAPPGNASLHNWAGHVNSYDPTTKTFHISITWVSTAPAYREYEIVLKYKGPR